MNTRMIVSGVTAVLSISACASSDIPDRTPLSTKSGMTIYTFDKDSAGKSNCNGPCAAIWPPVKPSDVSGQGFSTITRGDGSEQAAYKGKPVYLFAADQKPGETKGDNIENVWHVVPLASGIERPKRGSSGGYGGYGGYGY